jgi:hypothetical protein
MTVVTTLRSAIVSVLCRNTHRVLSVVVGVFLVACSLDSTLDTLASQFPKHRTELQQLAGLIETLHGEIGMTGYTRFCKSSPSPPCIRIGDGDDTTSLDVALKKFPHERDQLAQISNLATSLKLDYVGVYLGEYIRVTMKGGGTLGGDVGYLFSIKGGAPSRAVKYFKEIPGEEKWYAFVG